MITIFTVIAMIGFLIAGISIVCRIDGVLIIGLIIMAIGCIGVLQEEESIILDFQNEFDIFVFQNPNSSYMDKIVFIESKCITEFDDSRYCIDSLKKHMYEVLT